MMEKICAIVLAAGRGSRMQSDVPKQYLAIQDRPILYYSLEAFQASKEISEIILVVSEGEEDYCRREIVDRYGFSKVTRVITGGKERYDSVYCGLLAAGNPDYVLIHDSARPCIDGELIERCIENVRMHKACIAAVKVKDTIKSADEKQMVEGTPDRSRLWQVQTPQCFSYSLILDAYRQLYERDLKGITDDAMVLEQTKGYPIYLMEGSYKNIKVTTQEDLIIASAFLKENTSKEK